MISPTQYSSIGEILRDAVIQFKSETALIEMQRKTEAERLSYREFGARAERLACCMEHAGVGADSRVAILMSNQSKWLISAYAPSFAARSSFPSTTNSLRPSNLPCLRTANRRCCLRKLGCFGQCVVRPCSSHPDVGPASPLLRRHIWVTEAREGDTWPGVMNWEALVAEGQPRKAAAASKPTFVPQTTLRHRGHRLLLRHFRTSQGCLLTHDNYLFQLESLSKLYPLETGHRYFSILPTNHAIDFMCGFIGPLTGGATVVHQRALRPEYILDTLRRCRITHMALVPLVLEAFERAIREKLDQAGAKGRRLFDIGTQLNARLCRRRHDPNSAADCSSPCTTPLVAAWSCSLRRGVRGPEAGAVFLRPRHSRRHRLRAHRMQHRGDGQ